MLFMLDTDISSYIIKGGYGPVEQRLAETSPSEVCISVITQAELLYGLRPLAPDHFLQTDVRDFLSVTRVLDWNGVAAEAYADIRYQLIRKDGLTIGEMDMLIAAHAIAVDAVLVTNNTRHFERIRMPLMLANWME